MKHTCKLYIFAIDFNQINEKNLPSIGTIASTEAQNRALYGYNGAYYSCLPVNFCNYFSQQKAWKFYVNFYEFP